MRAHLVTCRRPAVATTMDRSRTDRSYVFAGLGNKIPPGTINRSLPLTEATFQTNGHASRRATTSHLSTCGSDNKKRWRVMPSRLHGAQGHPCRVLTLSTRQMPPLASRPVATTERDSRRRNGAGAMHTSVAPVFKKHARTHDPLVKERY